MPSTAKSHQDASFYLAVKQGSYLALKRGTYLAAKQSSYRTLKRGTYLAVKQSSYLTLGHGTCLAVAYGKVRLPSVRQATRVVIALNNNAATYL